MLRKLLAAAAVASVMLGSAPAGAQGLRYSEGYTFIKAVKDRDGSKVNELVGGARGTIVVNSRDGDTGETGLHIVVKGRDANWLTYLLGKGARTDIQDNAGNLPLGLAAQIGWVEGAEALLRRGAAVDGLNRRGETPLILAVHQNNVPMVRLLLSRGANPKHSDSVAGYSALDYAKRDGRSEAILRLLEEPPAKPKEAAGPLF